MAVRSRKDFYEQDIRAAPERAESRPFRENGLTAKDTGSRSYRQIAPAVLATVGITVAVAFSGAPSRTTDPDRTVVTEGDGIRSTAIPPRKVETKSEAGRQLGHIQAVTGLSDRRLAEAFPGGISRESINRWKNAKERPKPENLYAIGLLETFVKALERSPLDTKTWMHQHSDQLKSTPFEALKGGRLADAQMAVNRAIFESEVPEVPERVSQPQGRGSWDDDEDWI